MSNNNKLPLKRCAEILTCAFGCKLSAIGENEKLKC